jgi:hypothetical protein
VLAAYATVELLGWLQRTRLGRRRVVVAVAGAVLLGLLIAPPLWTSVRFDVESTRPDTGNAAREWIDRTFPPGTHFAVERFTPVLDTTRYSVVQEPRLVNRSVRSYRDDGVQYLIVSSMAYDRYGPEHNQTRSYQKLFALCPLVAEFPPIAGQRVGPTIEADNLFNSPQFAGPNDPLSGNPVMDISDPNFGKITASTGARTVRFGAKMRF